MLARMCVQLHPSVFCVCVRAHTCACMCNVCVFSLTHLSSACVCMRVLMSMCVSIQLYPPILIYFAVIKYVTKTPEDSLFWLLVTESLACVPRFLDSGPAVM